MSTIKSDSENLTLNAHGSGNDIKFQSNSVEVGSITDAGQMNATLFAGSGASLTNIPAAQITGTLPAISGANLTSLPADSTKLPLAGGTMTGQIAIDQNSNLRALTIDSESTSESGIVIDASVLTTGRAAHFYSNAPSSSTRDLVHVENVHASSTGTTAFKVTQNSTGLCADFLGDKIRAADGILFGTDTAVENALNDYEEGVWTPTLTCSTSGSYTLDSGANAAAYTKVGRVVHIQAGISAASANSPSGTIRMSLPFTPFTGTDDTDYALGSCALDSHGGTIDNGVHIFVFGADYAQFAMVSDSGGFSYVTNANVDSVWALKFTLSYITAA